MNPNHHVQPSVATIWRWTELRRWATLSLLVIAALAAGSTSRAIAAPQPTPLSLSSNRFLFVVETSAAMQSRAPGVLDVLGKLLASDLNGHLRRGDEIGLWTFNAELYAGQFPLQVWAPERRQIIVARITDFLRKQPLEKPAHLSATVNQMLQVIKNSDAITVVLLATGMESVNGTPFDNEINGVYEEQQKSMKKAAMPFVTVLRAKGGEIVNYSVNFAPWPIDMPIFPTPYEVAQIVAAQSSPANPPPAESPATNTTRLPLTEKTTESAADAKPDQPSVRVPVALIITNSVKPKPPEPPVELPPAKPEAPAVSVIPETVKAVVPEAPAPTIVTAKVANAETPRATTPQADVNSLIPLANPSATSSPVAVPTVEPTNLPAGPSSIAQAAVVVPPQPFFSGKNLLVIAIALLVVAGGLVILLIRRARPEERISLITRSMDRDKP